jgi:hypothetical protein
LGLVLRSLAHLLQHYLQAEDPASLLPGEKASVLLEILLDYFAGLSKSVIHPSILIGAANIIMAFTINNVNDDSDSGTICGLSRKGREIFFELIPVMLSVCQHLVQHAVHLAESSVFKNSFLTTTGFVVTTHCNVIVAGLAVCTQKVEDGSLSSQPTSVDGKLLENLFGLIDFVAFRSEGTELIKILNVGIKKCVTTLAVHKNKSKNPNISFKIVEALLQGLLQRIITTMPTISERSNNMSAAHHADNLWTSSLSLIVMCFQKNMPGFSVSTAILVKFAKAYTILSSRFAVHHQVQPSTSLNQVIQFLIQQSQEGVQKDDIVRSAMLSALQGICGAVGSTVAINLVSKQSTVSERLACIQLLLLMFRVARDAQQTSQRAMMGLLLKIFVRVVHGGAGPEGKDIFMKVESTVHTAVLGLLQVSRDVFKQQVADMDPSNRTALQGIMQKAIQMQQKAKAVKVPQQQKLNFASGF